MNDRHGRDNKLIVWKLGLDDEARMSTRPPLEPSTEPHPQPWILHVLDINTMNFCSFAQCPVSDAELLIAVPNTLASEAVRFQLLVIPCIRQAADLGAGACR